MIGTGLALGGTRLVESLVWGIEPTDPVTFVAVAVLLTGTASIASLIPAWRAARTSPLETLRAE